MDIISIPNITDEQLIERYNQIKPIVTIGGIKYYLRDYNLEELNEGSFMWDRHDDKRAAVDMSKFVEGKDFECLHSYLFHGVFNPNIAEILAQIPSTDWIYYDAFEIIEMPETYKDFKRNPLAFNQGFHSSTVRLYTSVNNPRVTF